MLLSGGRGHSVLIKKSNLWDISCDLIPHNADSNLLSPMFRMLALRWYDRYSVSESGLKLILKMGSGHFLKGLLWFNQNILVCGLWSGVVWGVLYEISISIYLIYHLILFIKNVKYIEKIQHEDLLDLLCKDMVEFADLFWNTYLKICLCRNKYGIGVDLSYDSDAGEEVTWIATVLKPLQTQTSSSWNNLIDF